MPYGRVFHLLADRMTLEGWLPLGCDGSRMECPRTEELEQCMGKPKGQAAPTLWLIALVSLTTGVLWSWRLGTSKTGERRWDCENSRILGEIGLVETEKSVAIPRHGRTPISRMEPHMAGHSEERPKETTSYRSPWRVLAGVRRANLWKSKYKTLQERLKAFRTEARDLRRSRSVASQGRGPGTGNQPIVPSCSSKSSSPPPPRAGGRNRS